MRIVGVDVEGFRSVGLNPLSITFPDIQRPFSIIGYNNSGKSNLLAAILHTAGVRSSYPTAFSEEDFFRCDLNNSPTIEIRITPPLKSANTFNKITE